MAAEHVLVEVLDQRGTRSGLVGADDLTTAQKGSNLVAWYWLDYFVKLSFR